MPIDEGNPAEGCGALPVPLRTSIYALLETVLALSEKVAEMPLCPEQIELVYHVRDGVKELSRLLKGPAQAQTAPMVPPASGSLPARPAPRDESVEAAAIPAKSCRFLLVESSPYRMAEMKRYLAGTPHHMDLAADSAAALALYHRNRYDAVFLDLRVAGITAPQMARLMRVWNEEQHRGPTPVIALASRREPSGEEEKEFDDVLAKPVSRAGFLQAVRKHGLSGADARPAGGTPAAASLLPAFLSQVRTGVEKTRQAVRDSDAAGVCAFAEALAATGGALGLPVLAMLGRKLRPAGQHRDWAKVSRYLDEIERCATETPSPAEFAGQP